MLVHTPSGQVKSALDLLPVPLISSLHLFLVSLPLPLNSLPLHIPKNQHPTRENGLAAELLSLALPQPLRPLTGMNVSKALILSALLT